MSSTGVVHQPLWNTDRQRCCMTAEQHTSPCQSSGVCACWCQRQQDIYKYISVSKISLQLLMYDQLNFICVLLFVGTGALWYSGSTLVSINEVNPHQIRLVLGWVTVSRFNSHYGTFILICNQPPRSTQPGHPFVGTHIEYQPKGGDALRVDGRLICVIPCYTWAISERFRAVAP